MQFQLKTTNVKVMCVQLSDIFSCVFSVYRIIGLAGQDLLQTLPLQGNMDLLLIQRFTDMLL